MTHPGRALMERAIQGQASEAEIERLSEHALACPSCRSQLANSFPAAGRSPGSREEMLLSAPLHLAVLERERAIETLLATEEWASMRQLSRKLQQERVAESKACHTLAFINLLLVDLRLADTGDQAEFIASLMVQAVKLVDAARLGGLREDLQAQAWTEVANSRRCEARWRRAEDALAQAERLLAKGTGDPLVEARLLSVKASLQSDLGQRSEALTSLLHCKRLYSDAESWPLLSRVLVKEASVLVELIEPERALEALNQAIPLIRDQETLLYAELGRSTCLLETNRLTAALKVYLQTQSQWAASPRKRIRLRSRFLGARLLEALGRQREAVKLFEDVIGGDLLNGFYKDAFLDLLYLFGVFLRSGNPEGARAVCRRALGQMRALDLVHEQLHEVWTRLLEAARTRTLDQRALLQMRDYLRVFWRDPDLRMPGPIHFLPASTGGDAVEQRVQGKAGSGPELSCEAAADADCRPAVETLLATVEWASLAGLRRKSQQERIIKARACHSLAFVNVLLGELRSAGAGEEAESTASLASMAINLTREARRGVREDLRAQVWIEVANSQRREAQWRRAEEALSQARGLLARGTGAPLIEARFLSVEASLRSDQGQRSEALQILGRCRKLYAENQNAPLLARTLIKEANVLVELIEPERALQALNAALPLIRGEDAFHYAQLGRATCFLETDRIPAALWVFHQTESQWAASPQARIRLRSLFLAARLLEVLGRHREAVRLFEQVIAEDLRHELYKDAFLDLLYLFGVYIRCGDPESAIEVCSRALAQMKELGLVHEQLYEVWSQLMEMARRNSLKIHVLLEAKEYLRVYWRYPAPQPPSFAG